MRFQSKKDSIVFLVLEMISMKKTSLQKIQARMSIIAKNIHRMKIQVV